MTENQTGATDMTDYFDADAAANAAFWSGQAAAARQQDEALKRLKALKGQTVTVVKGRKVPLGTTGKVFFVGEAQWGWRVGFETDDGETFWTDAHNVEKVDEAKPVTFLWDAAEFDGVPSNGFVTVTVNGVTVTINADGTVAS